MPALPRLSVLALALAATGACQPLERLFHRGSDEAADEPPTAARPHAATADQMPSGPPAGAAYKVADPSQLAPPIHVAGSELVDPQGQPVALHGLNYFGFNDGTGGPAGLWSNNPIANDFATIVLRQKLLGFNAVRLPFSFKDFVSRPRDFGFACDVPDLAQVAKSVVDPAHAGADLGRAKPLSNGPDRHPGQCNAYLPQSTLRDQFIWVAQFYVANGFYVLLDNHLREDPTATADPQGWAKAWGELVRDVLAMPGAEGRVLVDLLNEPGQRSIGWDTGPQSGVHRLYLSAMDAIAAVSAKVPLGIEGTGQDNLPANWGDGFASDPSLVRSLGLGSPQPFFDELAGKPYAHNVVLLPHVYGPSVTHAPHGNSGQELRDRLQRSFGTQMQAGVKAGAQLLKFPVAIGEFGSKFADEDKAYLDDFKSFLKGGSGQNPVRNWFYWSWNPNSGDTGGLVADDWEQVQWNKVSYLVDLGLTPFYLADASKGPAAPASNAPAGFSPRTSSPGGGSARTGTPGSAPPSAFAARPAPPASATEPAPNLKSHPVPVAAPSAGSASGCIPTPPHSRPSSPAPSTSASPRADAAEPAAGIQPPSGTQAPSVRPTEAQACDVEVDIDISGDWMNEGQHFVSLNLYLRNVTDCDIPIPYDIDIVNPAYRTLGNSWNMAVALKDGHVRGQVTEAGAQSWQELRAHKANTVPIGFYISGDGDDLTPTEVRVNDKPCHLRVLRR